MIKINNIQLVDGRRVSTQEETGSQIDDLRNLSEKANRYAAELESALRGIAYSGESETENRLTKAQSEFIAAVQFAMIYENGEEKS